jgi:HlyD family secretion protein
MMMMTKYENKLNGVVKVLLARKKLVLGSLGVGAVLVLLAFGPLSSMNDADGELITYTVKKDNLIVDIIEAGSIEASESEIIRSKVEGRTTIISLVPEGTLITEKDVEEGMILVELDSSQLRDQQVKQEITVQGESAKFADAKASHEIRVNQNESNLKQGELKVKFAKMDIQKYLGSEVAALFLEGSVEFSALLADERLDGEALKKKRKLESDIDLAKEEVARAVVRLDWTKKLFEKGYVTRDDLQADELALKREEVSQEQAETSLKLFTLYEFEKETEKRRSDYEEAVKELERIIAQNRAELSKAEARLTSAEASYEHQVSQLEKIREQIKNCTIRAPQPGLVVYAGINQRWQNNRVEEGKQVREEEEIITIPNTISMMARTTIHESVISRVREGQKAFITIDSLPGKNLEGEVVKVAVLPDQQNRWLNPNLKVYETDVSISGTHPELKPGMSAEVRIIATERKGVLMIPLQAVVSRKGKMTCLVKTAFGTEPRKIKTGQYNDSFIEVKKGLTEGETVVLNAEDFFEG